MKEIFISRDPSGFVFKRNGKIYRAINYSYQKNYEHLIQSGLYDKLLSEKLLIYHEELKKEDFNYDCYKVIKPVEIEFVSYPYEWSFEQLKDAAIITLQLQKTALDHNMSLKDASAYNVQFLNCRPVLIDTLSFEIYNEGYPWVAYKQFCQHFLAPLLLMSYKDLRLHKLLYNFSDGIPLDLANSLLPLNSKFNPKTLLHITLHSKAQKKFSDKKIELKKNFSKESFYRLIDSLLNTVESIKLKGSAYGRKNSGWMSYYDEKILSKDYIEHKKQLVNSILEKENPRTLWDLGANTGVFSKIAAGKNIKVICFDSDPAVVNKIYLDSKAGAEKNILPLIMDLVNPSGSSGWAFSERASLMDRPSPDLTIALALIHHLSIANNIPFSPLAEFFSKISGKLIIEFVPKDDPNAQLLLRSREDIFTNYTRDNFEKEFEKYFQIISSEKISGSERFLYLMKQ